MSLYWLYVQMDQNQSFFQTFSSFPHLALVIRGKTLHLFWKKVCPSAKSNSNLLCLAITAYCPVSCRQLTFQRVMLNYLGLVATTTCCVVQTFNCKWEVWKLLNLQPETCVVMHFPSKGRPLHWTYIFNSSPGISIVLL